MSTPPTPASALFNLLPAVYRIRDAEIAEATNPSAPGPLQSILAVVEEQLAILADNLDQLYDDQFIETCAPWVIPYIGDLIGYQAVNGIAPAVASPRAEVAHTISFRRRKGTVLVMEQLARDVTNWGAHAQESFLRLATTQYMNHIRPRNHYAPNLRAWEPASFPIGYQNSGFDETAHTVDVRRIAASRGRYNIQNIGIFLWSLNASSLTHAPLDAVPGQSRCLRFSALGRDLPLFNLPVPQGADIADPATPQNVPDCLTRRVVCRDIERITAQLLAPQYYGEGLSLQLYRGTNPPTPIDAANVRVANLSGPDGSWNNMPQAGDPIAIDPQLGRVALPPTFRAPLTATWHYGFNADLGGGEYSRIATFTASPAQNVAHVPADFATIHDALASLGGDGVVEISDSDTYDEPNGLQIDVKASGHIEIRAADGARPTLLIGDAIRATGGTESILEINGLVIAYAPAAAPTPPALLEIPATAGNALTQLGLRHLTLTPGWALNPDGSPQAAYLGLPAIHIDIPGLTLTVENAILGGLWLNRQSTASLTNSILDATDLTLPACVERIDPINQLPHASGALTLVGCTVIGKVHASLLSLVSNSIIWAQLTAADSAGPYPLWRASLWADRKQEGCVRFSYLPEAAITPRQFHCLTRARNIDQPVFYSLRYGDPGYAKLTPTTPNTIRRGADDGGEMGIFHFLLAPLRETDLNIRMREYLPVGLEFGVIYQN